ncbi:MAG: hypothetical protein LUD72_14295, partial [Bacteroidales bacterium]|nr:hypothetical protein [Bacteroidales bacterium]
ITPCRVGYVTDSTAYDAFTRYLDEYEEYEGENLIKSGIKYTDPSTGDFFQYIEYEDYDACESAMKKGDIDLFVADHSILMSHTVSGSVMLDDRLEEAKYAVGTKKAESGSEDDVTELTAAIDGLINGWLGDGTMTALLAWWLDEVSGTVLTPEHGFVYETAATYLTYTA